MISFSARYYDVTESYRLALLLLAGACLLSVTLVLTVRRPAWEPALAPQAQESPPL